MRACCGGHIRHRRKSYSSWSHAIFNPALAMLCHVQMSFTSIFKRRIYLMKKIPLAEPQQSEEFHWGLDLMHYGGMTWKNGIRRIGFLRSKYYVLGRGMTLVNVVVAFKRAILLYVHTIRPVAFVPLHLFRCFHLWRLFAAGEISGILEAMINMRWFYTVQME